MFIKIIMALVLILFASEIGFFIIKTISKGFLDLKDVFILFYHFCFAASVYFVLRKKTALFLFMILFFSYILLYFIGNSLKIVPEKGIIDFILLGVIVFIPLYSYFRSKSRINFINTVEKYYNERSFRKALFVLELNNLISEYLVGVQWWRGSIYLELGAYKKAAKYYKKALELEKGTEDEIALVFNLGIAYYGMGDFELAKDCFNKCVKEKHKTYSAKVNIVCSDFCLGNFKDAENLLINIKEDEYNNDYLRAIVAEANGKDEDARKHYINGLNAKEKRYSSALRLCSLSLKSKQIEKAKEWYVLSETFAIRKNKQRKELHKYFSEESTLAYIPEKLPWFIKPIALWTLEDRKSWASW